MLNHSASLVMSTSILKALPGKLDIIRHSPSILYISVKESNYDQEIPQSHNNGFVLWCSLLHTTECRKLQTDSLFWQKSCVCRSILRNSAQPFSHYLQSRQLVLLKSATPLCASGGSSILGSDLYKRMTWKSYLTNAETKAMKKLAILRKLAGTNWGAHEKIQKSVYLSTIRPVVEFGSTVWMPSAKSNQLRLDRVQNQALRLITAGLKSSPIKVMKEVTNITSLAKRRDAKALVQASKYQYLPDYPLKGKLERLTKNRFKIVHEPNRLMRDLDINCSVHRNRHTRTMER